MPVQFVVGSGANMCDFTYVENVAHANICAEQALCSNASSVAGKPFFVTNDEPIETWEFMSCLMEAMGCQRPKFNLPAKILSSAALFSNMMYHKLGLQILSSPLLHPDMVYFLSCTRTLSISRARKLLGYHPIVSLEVSSFRPCSIDNHSFHLVFSIYFAFYSFWRSIFIVDLFIFSKKPVSVFSLTLMLIYHSFDA
jgi:nucleoside-diphosphate-sugar epimerase